MSQTSVGVDFTLETVQYKFATIIGELCGKPSVLSQFAVWLDLRLSEYKLKGSISLDCSGLKPDPDWLQGLKDTAPPRTHHPSDRPTGGQHGHSRLSREAQQSERTTSCGADNAESPDIVVIKEEQNDSNDQEVYPVGLHENNTSTSSAAVGRVERKRFSDTNDLSPAKYQRFSSPLPQASHASFSQELSLSSHDQSLSRITETSVDSELEQFIQDNSSTYPRGHNSTAYADQGGNNSAEFFSASVLQDSSESAHSTDLKSTTIEETRGAASSSDAGNKTLSDAGSCHYRSESRSYHPAPMMDKISGANPVTHVVHKDSVLGDSLVIQDAELPKALSYKTQQNIAGAVASFWRWSRQIELPTDRQLFEIPPQELDGYLAQFFQAAKKPNVVDPLASYVRYDKGAPKSPGSAGHSQIPLVGLTRRSGQACQDTIKNTYSAVKVLQTWLACEQFKVSTPVEQIPPEDLDRYLSQFFAVVKNRQGGDYHPLSFNSLRSCLERYLHYRGYPCSIVKSAAFLNSRGAFKLRMNQLQAISRSQQAGRQHQPPSPGVLSPSCTKLKTESSVNPSPRTDSPTHSSDAFMRSCIPYQ